MSFHHIWIETLNKEKTLNEKWTKSMRLDPRLDARTYDMAAMERAKLHQLKLQQQLQTTAGQQPQMMQQTMPVYALNPIVHNSSENYSFGPRANVPASRPAGWGARTISNNQQFWTTRAPYDPLPHMYPPAAPHTAPGPHRPPSTSRRAESESRLANNAGAMTARRMPTPPAAHAHIPAAHVPTNLKFGPAAVFNASMLFKLIDSQNASVNGRKMGTIRDAFLAFDRNHDGTLTTEEFYDALVSMKLPITEEQLMSIVASADADGSGIIEWREFIPAAQRGVDYTLTQKHVAGRYTGRRLFQEKSSN